MKTLLLIALIVFGIYLFANLSGSAKQEVVNNTTNIPSRITQAFSQFTTEYNEGVTK